MSLDFIQIEKCIEEDKDFIVVFENGESERFDGSWCTDCTINSVNRIFIYCGDEELTYFDIYDIAEVIELK